MGIKATKYCEQCKEFKENVKQCHKCRTKFCAEHLVFYKYGSNHRKLLICAKCKGETDAVDSYD